METFYLSHKLLIHHVIAFASGEEGLSRYDKLSLK